MHGRRNRQRKEVTAKRKARARAETEGFRTGWPGLGRIWLGPALAGRAGSRLDAVRAWVLLTWVRRSSEVVDCGLARGEEKEKERKKGEGRRREMEDRRREREEKRVVRLGFCRVTNPDYIVFSVYEKFFVKARDLRIVKRN